MIINFHKARCLVVARKSQGSFTIVPGVNIIDKSDWDDIQGALADRIGEGKDVTTVVKVSKGPGGKEIEAPVELKDLEAAQAETIIKAIDSLDVIKKWLAKESRDGIRAALYNRQNEIIAATTPAAKG